MAFTIEQPKGMYLIIQNSFSVAVLVASIAFTAFPTATQVIKTLAETYLKSDTVAECLSEDAKGLK